MKFENGENSIVHRLPYEVISKIFSYLPSIYVKQARLVCRKWYEASNDRSVLKHQKFVFSNEYHVIPLSVMFDTLEESIFHYYNMEFISTSLNQKFDSFIESQGSMIYSLHFDHCSFSFQTLEKIMINCINLKELFFLYGQDCILHPTPYIPSINGKQIVRRNLKVLEFCDNSWMSDFILTVFLSVYPDVEKLVLERCGMTYDRRIFNRYYKNAEFYRPSHDVLTYRHFYQTVSKECPKIEKLGLPYPMDDGLSDNDLIALMSTSCFKLKELDITAHRAISSNALKNLPRHIVSLNVEDCPNFDFECLQRLLYKNPDLKFVHIDALCDVPKVEFIEAVIESGLKSFHCEILKADDLNHSMNNVTTNCHMEEFHFTALHDCQLLLLPMLTSFTNLTYLNISFYYYTKEDARLISSYIFQQLIHLETIKLCGNWINDATFENTAGRLRNLKNLTLDDCNNLTENAIKNFHYPKLEFLNLNSCFKIKDSGLIHLAETSPLLQHLGINETIISKKTLFIVCQKLKFLRYLLISRILRVTKDSVSVIQELQQCCPSLRFVEKFVYNPEKNCLDYRV